jgi:molybdopterin-guanine dinucleotide biosynthesis protein A
VAITITREPDVIDLLDIRPQLTTIILAGGQGARVANTDKGWLLWQGRPLIERVAEAARAQSAGAIISCNRNQARYAALGLPTVVDRRAGFQGPLAGIEAGLSICPTPWALILPCDSPRISQYLASSLWKVQQATGAHIVYARDRARDHYLFALWQTRLLSPLSSFLDTGSRAVKAFYGQQHAAFALIDEPGQFANINTLEDLR